MRFALASLALAAAFVAACSSDDDADPGTGAATAQGGSAAAGASQGGSSAAGAAGAAGQSVQGGAGGQAAGGATGEGGAGGEGGGAGGFVCGQGLDLTPQQVPPIHTPRWAFEPWISKDISDTDDTYAFVDGFAQRGIPVGVVVLDSPWETNYHTFEPDPVRYHDFDKMVADLKGKGIRTVLWMTQLVNSHSFDFEPGAKPYDGPSPNYAEAEACGYFINEGKTYQWWKGKGSGIDFENPEAVAWWHKQQERVLSVGVAGFKLDFGDSYVTGKTVKTRAGEISHQEYSESYYRDFYANGVNRLGAEEYVTMVRPYDKSYQYEGRFFARKEHAPVAWVGDNRRDFVGLRDALDHIFVSADAGYVVLGSDIGGYLDLDDVTLEKVPPNIEAFLRWTAVGALTPFMQLHGRANLTPWTVTERVDQSVATWRYWATLHHELVPFFYSLAEEAYAGDKPIIRPVGTSDSWPGDYRYHLGDAFLVAPIVEVGDARDVALPEGAGYYDYFAPEADKIAGGTLLEKVDASDWGRVPLYVREGAIVPMNVDSDVTGHGGAFSAGHLTLLVYPGAQQSKARVHDEGGGVTEVTASLSSGAAEVRLSRAVLPVLARIRDDAGGSVPSLDGAALSEAASLEALAAGDEGYVREAATRSIWVKVKASEGERVITTASPN